MIIYDVRVDLTRSLKQYESDKVGLSAALESGDNVYEVIQQMKDVILGKEIQGLKGGEKIEVAYKSDKPLSLPVASPAAVQEVKEAPKTKAKKKPEQVVVEQKVEAANAEGEVVEAKVEVKDEVKTKKSKFTTYNRDSDLHKKHVAGILDSNFHGWRDDGKKLTKAQETSQKMVGKDFMDAKGEVLESFKTEFISLMNAA